MKQPINFVQKDLDQYAVQANELHSWLDEQSTDQTEQQKLIRIAIPPQLTAVPSLQRLGQLCSGMLLNLVQCAGSDHA